MSNTTVELVKLQENCITTQHLFELINPIFRYPKGKNTGRGGGGNKYTYPKQPKKIFTKVCLHIRILTNFKSKFLNCTYLIIFL